MYVRDPDTHELPAPLVREWTMMKESMERAKQREALQKESPVSEKPTSKEKGKKLKYIKRLIMTCGKNT